MSDSTPHESFDDASPEEQADILISRMIDGRATAEDLRAFEKLAGSKPLLWRELAVRQRDAAALASAVESHTATAERVELPSHSMRFEHARRGPWLLASAGWAAALMLAVVWYIGADYPAHETGTVARTAEHITPEDQLRSYLQAPYVLGELDPVMERLDPLPDGRIAVVALRRIQEVVFLDNADTLPVDDELHFLKDPAELRAATH